MNRDFLKNLGLSDDVIESVMAEHGKDVQGEREKGAKASADLEKANSELSTYRAKVTDLEKNAGDNASVKKELEDLKAKIAAEAEAAKAKAADEALTENIKKAIPEGKTFINAYTESAMIQEIKEAMKKPENVGKGISELFGELTKDKEGIFKAPVPKDQPGIEDVQLKEEPGSIEAQMREIFGLTKKKEK